ncbi:alpha/beta hydrolase [Ammoniphilus sp. 3BR4]|uniref:alpha/beta hydrolase n=1 Tax=Ammoniphilus sp. 3BR4 TaxID=3158265 RepID=UPI003467D2E7
MNVLKGGSGPPLLLLHGNPQTYVMWHKVVDELAEYFTVVATDLRGYGDSSKPEGLPNHSNYSKRVMAQDQLEVMMQLGFESFYLVGHDRGARVAYRLALDHPERVKKLVLLDIVPTVVMYERTNMEFSHSLFHWFFLTQKKPFPENMISSNPECYLENALHISRYNSDADSPRESYDPIAYSEYLRCFKDPHTIHGICEDYRAGASIDLIHDRDDLQANRKIECDLLVIWGANGLVEKFFRPLDEWNKFAKQVEGRALPCGHFIPEEAPELLLEELYSFFKVTELSQY